MKLIKYKVNITDKDGNIIGGWGVERLYSEVNEEIAKKEAYNGEYTVEDDGKPEPISEPTQLDRLESQIAYIAMMTGNTDILEV